MTGKIILSELGLYLAMQSVSVCMEWITDSDILYML